MVNVHVYICHLLINLQEILILDVATTTNIDLINFFSYSYPKVKIIQLVQMTYVLARIHQAQIDDNGFEFRTGPTGQIHSHVQSQKFL